VISPKLSGQFMFSFVLTHNDSFAKVHTPGADKSLAPPGRKQAKATEDFDVHISYLLS
jgi:hypothetical protein